MNKQTSWLLIAGLGLAAWYWGKLGQAANVVNVVFNGIQVNGLTSFTLNFVIQNVSNAIVSVNSVAANVTANGTTIGNASYFGNPITIPANSQQSVPLQFAVSLLGLPNAIIQLISNLSAGTNSNITFEAKGNMNINGLVLPLDVQTQTIL